MGIFQLGLLFLATILQVTEGSIDCSKFNSATCQQDAIKYCLLDGRIIENTCEVSSLVCEYDAVIDESFGSCVSTQAELFNCTGYTSDSPCLPDSIPYCLSNSQVVIGSCDAKKEVCENGQSVDISGATCNPPHPLDCGNFFPGEVCRPDPTPYCLTSGETINGLCETKKSICGDGKVLDATGLACEENGGNSVTSLSSIMLLLVVTSSSWCTY